MRRTIIACILALGLLATPLALADADAPGAKGKDRAAAARDQRDDRTNENESGEKPAWVAAFQARFKELRAAWHENATEIREKCHAAQKPGENATKDQRHAWAHCVKDGYKSWFQLLRAERKDARLAREA